MSVSSPAIVLIKQKKKEKKSPLSPRLPIKSPPRFAWRPAAKPCASVYSTPQNLMRAAAAAYYSVHALRARRTRERDESERTRGEERREKASARRQGDEEGRGNDRYLSKLKSNLNDVGVFLGHKEERNNTRRKGYSLMCEAQLLICKGCFWRCSSPRVLTVAHWQWAGRV